MASFVALLRAINVGKRQVAMAELRALAAELGLENPRTYVASGNLIYESDDKRGALEATLDRAISDRFGFPVETIVRPAEALEALLAANPFEAETKIEPNRVLVLFSKKAVSADAAELVQPRARGGERAAMAGGALWIHYASGVGVSKLTPALIDKACGSPTTGRNVKTLAKLIEFAAG